MGLDPATSEVLCQRLPRLSLMADQRLLAQGDGQEVAFL